MKTRTLMIGRLGPIGCAAVLSCVVACSTSNNPSQPSYGGPTSQSDATASVTGPQMLTPPAGAVVRNADQPLTLVVRFSFDNTATTATYTFEVATDAAFANKAFTKSGVPQGSN